MTKSSVFLLLALVVPTQQLLAEEQIKFCDKLTNDAVPDRILICDAMENFKDGFDDHALNLFKEAAKFGNKIAQYRVGLMYLAGFGVPKDRTEGTAWLLLANERNNTAMTDRLKEVRDASNAAEWRDIVNRAEALREEFGDRKALHRRAAWVRKKEGELTGSRLGNPMATVSINYPGARGGDTGNSMRERLIDYESSLRKIVDSTEYVGFEEIDGRK
jgi:hypothetical protein